MSNYVKKIFASIPAGMVVILPVIRNINDIVDFFERLTAIYLKSSLPLKFLYAGITIVIVLAIVIITVAIVVKCKKREKATKPMQEFLLAIQRLNEDLTSVDYVKPFQSKSFEYIMAVTSDGSKQYNAEIMASEGIDVLEYEAALAKKIARADEPESCAKSFKLLHEVINSWNVFLNSEKKIISYWTFIAVKDDKYADISSGKVNEMDIELKDVNFIDVPGRYWGYLLLSGSASNCKTQENRRELYDSWLFYIEELAKKGIYFNEIASMVGSEWGNSSLKNIGMTNYAEYRYGGQMYKYVMSEIDKIDYLVKSYPVMVAEYKKEYRRERVRKKKSED